MAVSGASAVAAAVEAGATSVLLDDEDELTPSLHSALVAVFKRFGKEKRARGPLHASAPPPG